MVYYDRIDVPEVIDVNKTSKSVFPEANSLGFNYVSNGCNNILIMPFDITNIAILNIVLIIVVLFLKLAKVKPIKLWKILC